MTIHSTSEKAGRTLQSSKYVKNLAPTPILDCGDIRIRLLAEQLQELPPRGLLQAAHQVLTDRLRPIYDLDERQPTSVTLQRGCGSCSQRMACLEAVSRAAGTPTRVHAFHVDGSFWYPRFPLLHAFIPKRILLLWPQFLLENSWMDFDELYGSPSQLAATSVGFFSNQGESLFEAVRHTPIDFLGKTCGLACARPDLDLSRFVLADEGIFDTRDKALDRLGSLQGTLRGHLFQLLYKGKSSAKV